MELVDWELATQIGRKVASEGPGVSAREARAVVAELQELAEAAVSHVEQVSLLRAPVDDNTAVVDRAMWIESNASGLASVVQPLSEVFAQRTGGASAGARLAGAKLSAVQLGAALGWMSGKVLGQYEVFTGLGQRPRLLLVAPNIVAAERAMDVPARDFRLWVCLHEEAHRVQFGASPWLSEHFAAEVNTFLMAAETSASEALKRLVVLARTLVKVISGDGDASLISAAQNDAQRSVFERLSALMALLEGHAEWVMDAVGPQVIGSLAQLRGSVDQRRANPGQVDGLLRRVMGMDAKMRQYSEGRVFVDAVVDQVGVAGFNQVWESPATLPVLAEIAEPERWVARVHGGTAQAAGSAR